MQSKLFVRNLSFKTTEDELHELFGTHGEVKSAKIITDRETGRPRGFAFVEMTSQQDAESAIRALDIREFGGRQLYVAFSEPREGKPSRAYGGRN